MSDIYTHEPVMDFTNPFLDFDQGYVRPFATILPTVKATLIPIPSEEESVMHPAFFTFLFTFILLLQDSLKISHERRQDNLCY